MCHLGPASRHLSTHWAWLKVPMAVFATPHEVDLVLTSGEAWPHRCENTRMWRRQSSSRNMATVLTSRVHQTSGSSCRWALAGPALASHIYTRILCRVRQHLPALPFTVLLQCRTPQALLGSRHCKAPPSTACAQPLRHSRVNRSDPPA